LIKAIAQAIPVYVMSVFKLPMGLCDELMKMIRRYWWGAENGRRKTHWVAWDIMLRPKDSGGVGFRDMRLFNQALLARQAWRLIQFTNTLCAQLLKAKYYPSGSLIDTVFTGNGSSTWHAIEYGLELLKKGVIWRVGNGAHIRAWRDPWIPKEANYYPRSIQGRCRFRRVSDFIASDGSWNTQRLQAYFTQEDVEDILKIHISNRIECDFIAWHPDKRGLFSVKSAYQLAIRENMQKHNYRATSERPGGERPSWKVIWQCKVLAKVKILAWRICRNAISTQANLARRRMATTDICRLCGTEAEDSFHVFTRCPHAKSLWLAMSEIWVMPNVTSIQNTGTEWLLSLLLSIPDEQRVPTLMTIWRIWHAHNEVTHDKPCPTI
jgi:hypothetical protein